MPPRPPLGLPSPGGAAAAAAAAAASASPIPSLLLRGLSVLSLSSSSNSRSRRRPRPQLPSPPLLLASMGAPSLHPLASSLQQRQQQQRQQVRGLRSRRRPPPLAPLGGTEDKEKDEDEDAAAAAAVKAATAAAAAAAAPAAAEAMMMSRRQRWEKRQRQAFAATQEEDEEEEEGGGDEDEEEEDWDDEEQQDWELDMRATMAARKARVRNPPDTLPQTQGAGDEGVGFAVLPFASPSSSSSSPSSAAVQFLLSHQPPHAPRLSMHAQQQRQLQKEEDEVGERRSGSNRRAVGLSFREAQALASVRERAYRELVDDSGRIHEEEERWRRRVGLSPTSRESVFVAMRKRLETEERKATPGKRQLRMAAAIHGALADAFYKDGLCPAKKRDGSPLAEITEVNMSMDLRHAVIRWAPASFPLDNLEDSEALYQRDKEGWERAMQLRRRLVEETQVRLDKATKRLRFECCRRLKLKRMPALEFRPDEMVEATRAVTPLLGAIRKETSSSFSSSSSQR